MPDINSLDNMLDLIVYCLQPLRECLKKPVIITNGYRSYALWKKLQELGYNPSKTSMHLKGQAADIRVNGMSQECLFNFIRTSGVKYDQLIWEQDSNCVHISYVRCNNRQETLIRDKNFKYTKV
jgi:uncharacterized protein YcbK (DUF882 family)